MSEPVSKLPSVLRLVLAAVVAAVATTPTSSAQAGGERPLPYLLDVGDRFALVRYSPGALDRASHVQRRFALLAEDFEKWSKQLVPVGSVLLSRTDWEALELAVPYGLPARMTNGEIAVAAWGDHGTVALWNVLLGGQLPQLAGHPLHGTRREASSLLLNDLLAQGVAARFLVERAGYAGGHPDVVNFAAHVIALAASNLHERLSLGDITRIYSTRALDPSGTPTGDDVWRSRLAAEGRYHRAAAALIEKRGPAKAPKAILKMLRKDTASLTPRKVAEKFPEVAGLLPGT